LLGVAALKLLAKAVANEKDSLALRTLNLYGNNVGNKGVKYVLKFLAKAAVTKLDLGSMLFFIRVVFVDWLGNNIGDHGFAALARHPSIRHLAAFRFSRMRLMRACD
jgi:hypothetical protein